eukprot:CAMPEP_0179119786 /NCGR_PEP_ID=MMETSP0796-20121207/56409_1 /TAXON_ID=73915 /ORGANISM="Pyrodinium bahamense, Strain pbaha01" /LENGTH=380 /DNA_ID=CAMNT_0020818307 /DNA_START=28 /DNA_END=1168 /DNA_ORIENTATION=-
MAKQAPKVLLPATASRTSMPLVPSDLALAFLRKPSPVSSLVEEPLTLCDLSLYLLVPRLNLKDRFKVLHCSTRISEPQSPLATSEQGLEVPALVHQHIVTRLARRRPALQSQEAGSAVQLCNSAEVPGALHSSCPRICASLRKGGFLELPAQDAVLQQRQLRLPLPQALGCSALLGLRALQHCRQAGWQLRRGCLMQVQEVLNLTTGGGLDAKPSIRIQGGVPARHHAPLSDVHRGHGQFHQFTARARASDPSVLLGPMKYAILKCDVPVGVRNDDRHYNAGALQDAWAFDHVGRAALVIHDLFAECFIPCPGDVDEHLLCVAHPHPLDDAVWWRQSHPSIRPVAPELHGHVPLELVQVDPTGLPSAGLWSKAAPAEPSD